MGFLAKILGTTNEQEMRSTPARNRSAKDSFEKRRKFHSTYNPQVITELITGKYDLDVLPEAPIVETVYYSEKTQDRIVFTGGNRVTTHWNIIIELEPEGGGTSGTVYVDRPKSAVHKWMGNVLQIVPDLRAALSSTGATFTNWESTDIFH